MMAATPIGRTLLTRYLTLGADINIIRTVKGSLRSVMSGVASYSRFFDLMGRPSFPPTEDTVQLWSATFKPNKTFHQYLAHLQKACLLLHHPIAWLTPPDTQYCKGAQKCAWPKLQIPKLHQIGGPYQTTGICPT